MFVNKGAKETIIISRKENFKKIYIRELIQEAKKLSINKEDLIEMITNYKG